MSNVFTAVGRIISVRTPAFESKTTALEVSISVPTGQPKAEGDEYAPANIWSFILWGNRADALTPYLAQGKRVFVTGAVGVPQTYEKDGETKVSLRLHNVGDIKVLDYDNAEGGGATATASAKGNAKGKGAAKAASKAKVEESAADVFGDDSTDDDFGF